jgi:hypothetical protein
MKKIIILGAGKFGTKAALSLKSRYNNVMITVVDSNRSFLSKISEKGINTVLSDAILFLLNYSDKDKKDVFIVPAVPIHVAFEWIKDKLSVDYKIEIIDICKKLKDIFVLSIVGKKGELYVSNADFICPDNCNEPSDICTYTQKPRPLIVYEKLKSFKYKNYQSNVIFSRQAAPGVGGYKLDVLYSSLYNIKKAETPIFLSTACKCHGIVNGFTKKIKQNNTKA